MLHTTPQRKLRLAIVTPWIRDSPGAQCWGAKLGKKLGHGEACSAAATSLPASWPLYVGSAEANAQVADFLIMHDALVPPHDFTPKGASKLPGNVKLIAVPNMLAHYRKALRLDVNLTSQKIKDLKAMVGKVFETSLSEYSHWGFADTDVVYGNLRRFLTPHVLKRDIVTFRTTDMCSRMAKTMFAGQLTLLSNNAWTRELYQLVPKWGEIMLTPRTTFFEERSLPSVAVKSTVAKRVAYVVSQLSDQARCFQTPGSSWWGHGWWCPIFEDCGVKNMTHTSLGCPAPYQQLIYAGGRLAVVYHPAGCAVSEAAIVHMSKLKAEQLGHPLVFDSDGMAWDPPRGILTVAKLESLARREEMGLPAEAGSGTNRRSPRFAVQMIQQLRQGTLPSCPKAKTGPLRVQMPLEGDACNH
jgi:hypothetical protein